MIKNLIKILFILACIAFFGIKFTFAVDSFDRFRDLVSRSWPAATSTHAFTFITTNAIPPSGSIKIIPEIDDFIIPGTFNYTDVDLSVADNASGPYIDRDIDAVATALVDGVSVTAGTQGDITIFLNSSTGIDANKYVSIELGTNATYGDIGDQQIINPIATSSYKMEVYTYSDLGRPLDRGATMIAIIEPVKMSLDQPKIRANGAPNGFLAYGTTQTIMSLTTNYDATCRFTNASGTDYSLMTNQFTNTGENYHSILISVLPSIHYYYFIRCRDIYSVDDTTDYLIDFMIKGYGEGEGESQDGSEGGSGTGYGSGGSGSGSGGGAGGISGQDEGPITGKYLPYPPPPGAPGVVLEGWAYSNIDVVVLKDGTEVGLASANSSAEFAAFLSIEDQGVYTFSMWATDSEQRRSKTISTTFWVDQGTQSSVSDIILPPTIELGSNTITAGQTVRVIGQTVPSTTVEAWLYLPSQEAKAVKRTVITNTGKYELLIPTTGLEVGTYNVKVKTYISRILASDFSNILRVGIGETLEETGECAGADLNGDGRVNITDFSILLFWWNSSNSCADQNNDGTVNITDFSIMMFYWTG